MCCFQHIKQLLHIAVITNFLIIIFAWTTLNKFLRVTDLYDFVSFKLVNCSFTETFFHSSARLTSHRVVAVKGNDCLSSGNSMLPERVAVVFSNSHDANFASWQFFTCQNALWMLQNIHDAKFRVVDVSLLPHRVLVFFSLIERFPSVSVTYILVYIYIYIYIYIIQGARGGAVVEALCYKPEGRRIDSRWCHWNFSLT
jgi:hypothetical protein